MKTSFLTLISALATLTVAHSSHNVNNAAAVRHHRRHHARRSYDLASPLPKRATSSKKCKSKASSSGHNNNKPASKPISSSGSKTPASGSHSGKTRACPKGTLSVKGVCIGMLPDGGSDGGPRNTMAQLNNLIAPVNAKHAIFGQYAQCRSGEHFDGSQLLQVLDDVKESGAIFQPAVMPVGSWDSLKSGSDQLARDICTVMKKFTDEGIEVWLRFAHEVNWYQTDGTYQGNADDFKEGWNTVGRVCKEIAPEVKMYWTPNWASMDTYRQYYPGPEYMDYIGIDAYPKETGNLDGIFLSVAKELHDEYCREEGPHFAMGETGLAYGGNAQQKMQWMKSMVDAKENGMQYLHSIAWFNYIKSENGMTNIPFKIVDPDDSATTQSFIDWVNSP